MNKKLIFGSFFSMIILLLLPSVTSIEYNTSEKANEEYLMKLLEDNNIDPEQKGAIRKIIRLILKIITVPIRIIKRFLRFLCKIFTLPLRIFWCILEIITPFRNIKRCCHRH